MIAATCFTKEWLDECRGRVGRIDPGLLEKSIYAFDLLGRLAAEGLPFVFKGGTALLLMLDNFRRLSIDVDIACSAPRDEVARILGEVVRKSLFTAVEPDERDPARLPKRHHYALSFNSVVSPRRAHPRFPDLPCRASPFGLARGNVTAAYGVAATPRETVR